MGTIIYILGIVAAIWCVLDVFKATKVDSIIKLLIAILILATSWVGVAVYYFFVRERIQ